MGKNISQPKVLLISSVDPRVGPAKVALDYYKAFVQSGVEIDFLTKYPVEGHPEIKYVYKTPHKLYSKLISIAHRLTGLGKRKLGHYFFYSYECLPPVPVRRILSAIDKEYDLVLILFWQEMLSFSSIKGIYNKLHCQIHFMGVDYSQMSGGCHFTLDCQRYRTGCGMCPGIFSRKMKDFTYYNVNYRIDVYNKVKPVVYGNYYMREFFYKSSFLLKDARIEPSYDIYDLNEFYPMEKQPLRIKYQVPDNKRFVIFFGCQRLTDPRKGMDYLIDSLSALWKSLNANQREEIVCIVAGRNPEIITKQIKFDCISVGYVPVNQLPELYSVADCYLSPSIDDAGPTMVNQSLCCGTPVVAFEMGTALESIKNRNTGYCAKLKDAGDFAYGIEKLFSMSSEELMAMRENCRSFAVDHFSYSSRVKDILDIYKRYTNNAF